MAANDRPAEIQWLISNTTGEITGYMVGSTEYPPPPWSKDGTSMVSPPGGLSVPMVQTNATTGATELLGPDGVISTGGLGQKILTIGLGGNYPDLYTAIQASAPNQYSNFVVIQSVVGTSVNAINGFSPTIGVTGAQFRTDKVRTGDFIRKVGSTRRYRIRAVNNETTLKLYENWAEATIGGVAQDFYIERLVWKTYMFTDEESTFSVRNSEVLGSLPHGTHLCGFGKGVTRVSEDADAAVSGPVFKHIGMSRFSNISFAPTRKYGAMDSLVGSFFQDMFGGGEVSFDNVEIYSQNTNGDHSGSGLALPLPPGGVLRMSNTDVRSEGTAQMAGMDLTPTTSVVGTKDNTRMIVSGGSFGFTHGYDNSVAGTIAVPSLIQLNKAVTASFIGTDFITSGWAIDPSGSFSAERVCGIRVADAFAGPVTVSEVNLTGCKMALENTDASAVSKTVGVYVANASTVNIESSSISVSGSGATGVETNHASAVVNIRAGARVHSTVAGRTLVNTLGTINLSSRADAIGTNTGSITAAST